MAHILVVEDDDIVAELACAILLADGHQCTIGATTDEAWKLLLWRRPDLMLLDVATPGESGSRFMRHLNASAEFHDLPVLPLVKPIDPLLLKRTVDHLLQTCLQPGQQEQRAEFQLRTRKGDPPSKVYL